MRYSTRAVTASIVALVAGSLVSCTALLPGLAAAPPRCAEPLEDIVPVEYTLPERPVLPGDLPGTGSLAPLERGQGRRGPR